MSYDRYIDSINMAKGILRLFWRFMTDRSFRKMVNKNGAHSKFNFPIQGSFVFVMFSIVNATTSFVLYFESWLSIIIGIVNFIIALTCGVATMGNLSRMVDYPSRQAWALFFRNTVQLEGHRFTQFDNTQTTSILDFATAAKNIVHEKGPDNCEVSFHSAKDDGSLRVIETYEFAFLNPHDAILFKLEKG